MICLDEAAVAVFAELVLVEVVFIEDVELVFLDVVDLCNVALADEVIHSQASESTGITGCQ